MAEKFPNMANNTHAKMGTIKDRNGIDPIEAEDIKKRKNYTKMIFMTQITMMV